MREARKRWPEGETLFFELAFVVLSSILLLLVTLILWLVAKGYDEREDWVSACDQLVSSLYEPTAYAAAKSLSQDDQETDQVKRWRSFGRFLTTVLPKHGKRVRDSVDTINRDLCRKFPNAELSVDWENSPVSVKFHPWTVLMQDESGAVTVQFLAHNRERALKEGEVMVRRNPLMISFLLKDSDGKIVEQIKPQHEAVTA